MNNHTTWQKEKQKFVSSLKKGSIYRVKSIPEKQFYLEYMLSSNNSNIRIAPFYKNDIFTILGASKNTYFLEFLIKNEKALFSNFYFYNALKNNYIELICL